MPEVTSHVPGSFCWVELSTNSEKGAIEFYTQLFGWTTNLIDMGEHGNYVMFQKNGKDVAAAYENKTMPAPPYWASYVSVTSADETAAKAKSLGGTLIAEPMDVFDSGRMVPLQDPQGAIICAWQPKQHIGVTIRDEDNSLCWNELLTPDAASARSFYAQLFEWNVKISTGDMPYTEVTPATAQQPVGGIFEMTADMKGIPPHWAPYFAVANVDDTVKKVQSLGGKVQMPAKDIPGVGRISMVADPQGANFYVIKLDLSAHG